MTSLITKTSKTPILPKTSLPTMYDLPSEDPEEYRVPDLYHSLQAWLLDQTFRPRNWDMSQVFSALDLYIYYDVKHKLWYKRPDWFGAVGVSRLYENRDLRLSYVMWQEEVPPLVVTEFLSPGTQNEDLGQTQNKRGQPPTKWTVYEQILQVPYYVIFSRYTNEMQAFVLRERVYQRAELREGRLLVPEVQLSLGVWHGEYEGAERDWLRWMTLEGQLIPTPQEEALMAQQEVAQAQQEMVQAQQEMAQAQQEAIEANRRADILARELQKLGIDPNQLF